MFNKIRSILGLRQTNSVHEYGLLFFDHLKCDYLLVESKITDTQDKKILEEIISKRENGQLTWEDMRAFDLIVLKYQDAPTIKGKLEGLKKRFEVILTPQELEALKNSPKSASPGSSASEIDDLRAEYSVLVREFCIRYSFSASREGLRSLLLRSGAGLTLVFCILMLITGFLITLFDSIKDNSTLGYLGRTLFTFSTLLMVVFAGITGAFVSMQQRIQNVVYRGDPIYDLSGLTHGWLSIFLSPLSGAIFAVILYLFFAGQLLSGTIFPAFNGIEENRGLDVIASAKLVPKEIPNGTNANASPNTNTNTSAVNMNTAPNTNSAKNTANTVTDINTAANTNTNTNTTNTQPTETVTQTADTNTAQDSGSVVLTQPIPIQLIEFLVTTGPKGTKDFALLLIWCFIAGFAERFVPDALNRLVSKQGETKTETK